MEITSKKRSSPARLAYMKAWRLRNPDYYQNWRAKNAPSPRFYKHTHRIEGVDYTREKVRIRDNHTCQSCKKVWVKNTRRFDVHHLNGLCGKLSKKYDRVDSIDGLITLCHRCHYNHPSHTNQTRPKT